MCCRQNSSEAARARAMGPAPESGQHSIRGPPATGPLGRGREEDPIQRANRDEDEERRRREQLEQERADEELARQLMHMEEVEAAEAARREARERLVPEADEAPAARRAAANVVAPERRPPDAAFERRPPAEPASAPRSAARAPRDADERAAAGAAARATAGASRAGAAAAANDDDERAEPQRCFKFAIAVPKVVWMEAQRSGLAELDQMRSADGLVISLTGDRGAYINNCHKVRKFSQKVLL